MFNTIDKRINNKRAIFVDFDDTIFIHKAYNAKGFDEDGISRDSWFNIDHVYDDRGDRNDLIYNLLKRLKEQYNDNIDIIGLTWVYDSNVVRGKHKWVNKHEPGIFTDMIGVSEKIGKVKIMELYCKEKTNWDKRSVCLIDDDLDTIKAARTAGYDAWQTVAAMQYEYSLEKQEKDRETDFNNDYEDINNIEKETDSNKKDVVSIHDNIEIKVKYIVGEERVEALDSGSDFRTYGEYDKFEDAWDKYIHSMANTIYKKTKTYKDDKLIETLVEYWDNETKSFRE